MFERMKTAVLVALAPLALAVLSPTGAAAHGGTTIANGSSGGVTVLVQGSDVSTESGKPAADLATTLAGPGTGSGSRVVYYVRPQGGESFRVDAERDEGGVHHRDVATAGRGDWRAWDVSAIVTLSGGKRLRVTNAKSNAPGPDPAQADTPQAVTPSTPPTTPTATATPTTPTEPAVEAPVEDVSGESEGAPAWAIPSLAVLIVLGVGGLAIAKRRSSDEDDED